MTDAFVPIDYSKILGESGGEVKETSSTSTFVPIDYGEILGERVPTRDGTRYTEESLSVDPKWLQHAKTIYESEKGEPYKKSDEKLAEWLKNRHSEVGWDLVEGGKAAAKGLNLIGDMSDKTKEAWIESMTMYDLMEDEGKTYRRNIKNVLQDYTTAIPFIGTLAGAAITAVPTGGASLAGAGVLMSAKMAASRAASTAARITFKGQLKKALLKRKGVSKTDVNEFMATGFAPNITRDMVKKASKEAVKVSSRYQAGIAAGWGAVGGIESGLVEQLYREGKDAKDIDYTKIAADAAMYGGGAALLFGGSPRLWRKFRKKKVLAKFDNELAEHKKQEAAKLLKKNEVEEIIPIRASDEEIENIIKKAASETSEKGTVRFKILGTPNELLKQIIREKIKRHRQKFGKGKIPEETRIEIIQTAKKEATNIRNNTERSIKHHSEINGIEIAGKIGAKRWFKKTATSTRDDPFQAKYHMTVEGKRVGPAATETVGSLPDGRNIFQKQWAKWSRKFGGQRSQEVTDLHRRFKGSTDHVLKAAARRIAYLEKALMEQFGVTTMKELPPDTLEEANKVLISTKPEEWALYGEKKISFSSDVLKALKNMRNDIERYQKNLLESGVIDKKSDLHVTIRSSIDGNTEFYINRQYEIFDNSAWTQEYLARSAPERITAAREFFKAKFIDDERISESGTPSWLRESRFMEDETLDKLLEEMPRTPGTSYFGTIDDIVRKKGIDSPDISDEARDYWYAYMGKNGAINTAINDIFASHNTDDIWKISGPAPKMRNKAGKILNPRQDIPEAIRALMGEYKDPFTNYRNTVMKINQVVETYKYSKAVADLIKAGKVSGAGKTPVFERGQSVEITSSLPKRRDLRDAYRNFQDFPETELLGKKIRPVSPLDKLYATEEIADAIMNGNEITRTIPAYFQKYLLLQAHTRAAKTMGSPIAYVRNFLSAGWMAIGAGYMDLSKIKAGMQILKGMSKWSTPELNAQVEKLTELGINQSGIEVGTLRDIFKIAGEPDFFTMQSSLFTDQKKLRNKLTQLNVSLAKWYQAMDDVWKTYAFENEKQMNKQILIDQGKNPDQVMKTIMSGDEIPIKITLLDQLAAKRVSQHMQNYGGVPQIVREARLFPAADFLAFTTEMVRTQYHILNNSLSDIKQGTQLLAASNGQRGNAQVKLGMHRLGSVIAAQSAAPALALTTSTLLGMDKKLEDSKYTIREGIEFFDAPFDKGDDYLYFSKPENGKGKRTNVSYVNPWAKFHSAIAAGIEALKEGEDVDGKIMNSLSETFLKPMWDTIGPSMLFEAGWDLVRNRDEYGRPLTTEGMTERQKWRSWALTAWEPFEPGAIKLGRDFYTSLANRPEGKKYGVKRGRTLQKRDFKDEVIGLSGFKPKPYDIGQSLGFKIAAIKNDMGDARNIFMNVIREQAPTNRGELIDAYEQSLAKSYSFSKSMFDVFEHARSVGMSDKKIRNALSKEGLFKSNLDKRMLMNLLKGKFMPPPPSSKHIRKWIKNTENQGGSPPPLREAMSELKTIYRNYKGISTGTR